MAESWGFMPDEGNAFFISYNSDEWKRIAPIAKILKEMGYPIWYDQGLKADTAPWKTQISASIERCDAAILFVTKGIFEKEKCYVIHENDEATGISKTVIPVFLDNIEVAEVPTYYRAYVTDWKNMQGVPYRNETPQETAVRIANAIESSKINHKLGSEAVDKYRRTQAKKKRKKTMIPVIAAVLAAAVLFGIIVFPKTGINVGDHIRFGSYVQTGFETEVPVEWRVLDIHGGNALLISEYLLDVMPYNETDRNVTWSECSLRKWLNGDFFYTAFSEEERSSIVLKENKNPDNPEYQTLGGSDTKDYVFCLSIDEAKKYLKNYNERKAAPTAYALTRGGFTSDNNTLEDGQSTGWWWLRSPGYGSPGEECGSGANVGDDGIIYGEGTYVSNNMIYVRPVIVIRLSAFKRSDGTGAAANGKAAAIVSNEQNTQTVIDEPEDVLNENTKEGEIVSFGRYPQTEDGEIQSIDWRVLDVRDNKALMISEYLLDAMPYNDEETSKTWDDCTLREWLNGDFYENAFSDEEKSRIILTKNENPDNPEYGTACGNDTEDYVFCLSIEEAVTYFKNDKDRMAVPTAFAIKRGAFIGDEDTKVGDRKTGWWWLRSLGEVSFRAADVEVNGEVDNYGYGSSDFRGAIRPVIFVSLSE